MQSAVKVSEHREKEWMTMKDLVHSLIAPFVYRDGTVIIPYRLHFAWPERQFIRRFLKRLAVDCVWDVGANVGQYGSELRLLGYRGLMFSFEPDPASFSKLKERAKGDKKWFAFNLALGREPGTFDLNVMAKPVYNSFLEPSVSTGSADAVGNSVVGTVSVDVETVGRLFPDLEQKHGFRRAHLKLDTQGFDLEVFAGAQSVHDRLISLQSEVAFKPIYQRAPKWREALSVYEQAGFEVAGLFPVNPHRTSLSEMDCFLQREAST